MPEDKSLVSTEVEERRVDVLALVLVPSPLFFLVVVASFFFRVCFKMTE